MWWCGGVWEGLRTTFVFSAPSLCTHDPHPPPTHLPIHPPTPTTSPLPGLRAAAAAHQRGRGAAAEGLPIKLGGEYCEYSCEMFLSSMSLGAALCALGCSRTGSSRSCESLRCSYLAASWAPCLKERVTTSRQACVGRQADCTYKGRRKPLWPSPFVDVLLLLPPPTAGPRDAGAGRRV